MSSQILKNVMVAGGRGVIGTPIINALLASGLFNVSVLSRAESTAVFPPTVNVKKADHSSHKDLVEALKGQDALICTLSDEAGGVQVQLIDAAIEAGVKRFLPSEWGNCHIKAPVPESEPVVEGKNAIIEVLKEKTTEAQAKGQEFHWTGVNVGLFFDWSLKVGFMDVFLRPTKTAKIWDGGSGVFSTSNLSTVTAGVVAILSIAEAETRDRFVNIESFATSQREVVAALEKATGEKWTVEETSMKEQLAVAQEMYEKEDYLNAFYRWVLAGVVSGREEPRFKTVDNELLGLPHEDMQETVEKLLKGESI
ncbi:hypothetical protein V498_01485 [Pseudogymnoascus sp. VKM F-4517 (FW-2822)]|nr:hypothetical protein V498_01485 [Pseudogymnoascus sp. VKM F-4517 (FW-2822)]